MFQLLKILLAASLVSSSASLFAQSELRYVAVLNRHGVRTPLQTNAALDVYSSEPWPKWDVPVGYLTKQGFTLMKLVGAYDGEYLRQTGLLAAGCADAGKFYFWADDMERDIRTGEAIAEGMLPGCAPKVHSAPPAKRDPLFAPVERGVAKPDPIVAAAAVSGRIGGHPELLVNTWRGSFEFLQSVLTGPEGKPVKKVLLEQPSAVTPQKDRLAQLTGPLNTAASMAENFVLEYTDGKPDKDVGWGRLDKAGIEKILLLQEAYNDLTLRTPYLARASGSNILGHMLHSMQQAVSGSPVEGALGSAGDKGLFLIGHDSDMSNLGGMMGVSWLLEGYQPNSRPPGAALVFEIWRDKASGKYSVHTFVMAQSMDQMRHATPLSLKAPPEVAPIFIPGCSGPGPGFPCEWDAFERAIGSAINPAFVSNAPFVETP